MKEKSDEKKEPRPQSLRASPRSGYTPPLENRWKPGQSGNPSGRKSAGLSIKEWINQMQEWPRKKIREVIKDQNAPMNKVWAARISIHAGSMRLNSAGAPIAGPDVDRIIEHTEGKAKQSVDITSNGETVKQFVNLDTDRV